MWFENVALILPGGPPVSGCLRAEGGVIREIHVGSTSARRPDGEIVDGGGGFLTPGFLDLHVHGARGRDAMEAGEDAFAAILDFHASGGTTALALTSVAATLPDLLRLLAAARQAKSARLLGVHLEGPYFAPTRAGAHRPDLIRLPTPDETRALLEYAGTITQMTLAPELPGALELIAELHARHIIASGGHSDAWDEDAQAAFARGMSQVTHVLNAMSGARRRGAYRVAGLVEAALAAPGIRCELIADGHHVSPTLMRMLYRAKGPDRICLVTDATAGAGLPVGSAYRLGTLDCVVRDGVGLTADGSALAGSTSTMIDGVRNLVRLAGVPLEEAVRMASLNPARALGVEDGRGSLRVGLQADLVLLSPDLEVRATFSEGRCIYRSSDECNG